MEKKQEQNKTTIENNNILMNFLLKTNKLNSIIQMLLDFNNYENYKDVIVSSLTFKTIDEQLYNLIQLLEKDYINLLKSLTNQKGDNNNNE